MNIYLAHNLHIRAILKFCKIDKIPWNTYYRIRMKMVNGKCKYNYFVFLLSVVVVVVIIVEGCEEFAYAMNWTELNWMCCMLLDFRFLFLFSLHHLFKNSHTREYFANRWKFENRKTTYANWWLGKDFFSFFYIENTPEYYSEASRNPLMCCLSYLNVYGS